MQSRGFCGDGGGKNDVLNGIRMTATALRTGQIKVTKGCVDAVREFSLYRWADDGARDVPVKENDHAMDDIRYFVSTVLGASESFACAVQRETGKGVSIWDFEKEEAHGRFGADAGRVPAGAAGDGGDVPMPCCALREQVPIIDAAIYKLVRLIGGFEVYCPEKHTENALRGFLKTVPVNGCNMGIDNFLSVYFEQLLTYGNAIGEIVLANGEIRALYNASLEDLEIRLISPLETGVFVVRDGRTEPCRYPELILTSALNPMPGSAMGSSILKGLPFVSEVLLKIYRTVGINWERMGNVRFAVTCKNEGYMNAGDRAGQLAKEWSRAMHGPGVSDFVAVGDVQIKAIGADGQQMDSEVPVRQMLEQVVAKMGIPPFLLGLSWSSTERMSSQQADMLTSELTAYRRILEPAVLKICKTWLRLNGLDDTVEIDWNEITMQDEVDHANAAYLMAKTGAAF